MALRHAGRTIGGRALQRAQADVQLPRFVHSGKPACSRTVSPTSTGPRGDAGGLTFEGEKDLLEKIKRIKEDVYTTFAELERKRLIHGRQNGELLEHLSAQVEPKLNDPLWRKHQREKWVSDFTSYAGLFCSSYLALGWVSDYFTGADPKERNQIEPSVES